MDRWSSPSSIRCAELVIAAALRQESSSTPVAKWHARVKEEALAALPKPPEKKQ